jgi:hypothetical protein
MDTTKKVSGESRSKIRLHLPKIQGSLGPLERNESTYTTWMRFILSIFICQWICQSIDWVCETNWPKVTAPELPYLSAWPPFHSKEKLQSRVLEFIPCRTAWRWCRVEHACESTHTTHWKKSRKQPRIDECKFKCTGSGIQIEYGRGGAKPGVSHLGDTHPKGVVVS